MSNVPPEVVNIIFSHLPVKSLLRFRCVSKLFCALIDSPYFIKYHLNQSLISNSHRTIISLCVDTDQIYLTEFDSNRHTLLSQLATELIGSCNGLLCLVLRYNRLVDESIYLFNPSTREHKLLLSLQCARGCAVYGLGYDSVTDDYKVVRIMRVEHEFMVYSLKSNSWRRIKDFPFFFRGARDQSVFVNGALHWLVSLTELGETQIVSFDLATEEYGLILLPEFQDRKFLMKVGELGGRLCLYCYHLRMDYDLDVWVMNCYGVKESWTKLLISVWIPEIPKLKFTQVNAYLLDDKQVLFMQDRALHWFDPKLRMMTWLRLHYKKRVNRHQFLADVYAVLEVMSLSVMSILDIGHKLMSMLT